jgi:excisionase family DNA binding protein
MTITSAPEWLALAEAARLAEVPRSTLDRAVRRGELPYAKTTLGRLFAEEDVLAWRAARDQKTRGR